MIKTVSESGRKEFLLLLQAQLKNGKTRRQIAKELGVTYDSVYSWLSGRRKPAEDVLDDLRAIDD